MSKTPGIGLFLKFVLSLSGLSLTSVSLRFGKQVGGGTVSRILDQIKYGISIQLSKHYRAFKAQMPPEDWKEFESWFWKIRPHLTVDITQYGSSCRVPDVPEPSAEKALQDSTK